MGKQHDTIPNEQPEMPAPEKIPEINKLSDPREPKIPNEDPQVVPDEFPPEGNPSEESSPNPGI